MGLRRRTFLYSCVPEIVDLLLDERYINYMYLAICIYVLLKFSLIFQINSKDYLTCSAINDLLFTDKCEFN